MMINEEEEARPVLCVETLKHWLWNQSKLTSVFPFFLYSAECYVLMRTLFCQTGSFNRFSQKNATLHLGILALEIGFEFHSLIQPCLSLIFCPPPQFHMVSV